MTVFPVSVSSWFWPDYLADYSPCLPPALSFAWTLKQINSACSDPLLDQLCLLPAPPIPYTQMPAVSLWLGVLTWEYPAANSKPPYKSHFHLWPKGFTTHQHLAWPLKGPIPLNIPDYCFTHLVGGLCSWALMPLHNLFFFFFCPGIPVLLAFSSQIPPY